MNKTLVLVAVICVAAGFLMQFTGLFNVTDLFSKLPNQLSGGFSNLTSNPIEFVTDNMAALAGSLTVITVAYSSIKSVFNRQKTNLEEKLAEEHANAKKIGDDYIKLNSENESLNKLLEKERSEVAKLKNTYSDSANEIDKMSNRIRQLEDEKLELKAYSRLIENKVDVTPKPEPIK